MGIRFGLIFLLVVVVVPLAGVEDVFFFLYLDPVAFFLGVPLLAAFLPPVRLWEGRFVFQPRFRLVPPPGVDDEVDVLANSPQSVPSFAVMAPSSLSLMSIMIAVGEVNKHYYRSHPFLVWTMDIITITTHTSSWQHTVA